MKIGLTYFFSSLNLEGELITTANVEWMYKVTIDTLIRNPDASNNRVFKTMLVLPFFIQFGRIANPPKYLTLLSDY